MTTATMQPAAPPGKLRRKLAAGTWLLCWIYLAGSILLLLLLRVEGERWWIATLILFGPRWLWCFPLLLLVPAAAFLQRRALWILAPAVVLVAGPVVGLNVPWRLWIDRHSPGPTMRVLTCNTHGGILNVPAMRELLLTSRPDVVVLQEWTKEQWTPIFDPAQWNVAHDGEFFVASHYPVNEVLPPLPPRTHVEDDAFAFDVRAPIGAVRVFCVHLASPHGAFRAALHRRSTGPDSVEFNSQERRDEARELSRAARETALPFLLAGDFNLPPDSEIFRTNFSWLDDAFAAAGYGWGLTYVEKWTTTRIDHILGGPGWQCRRCWVAPGVRSPHHPLIADLAWTGPRS